MKNNPHGSYFWVFLLFFISITVSPAYPFEWDILKLFKTQETTEMEPPPMRIFHFVPYRDCHYGIELNLTNLDKDKHKISKPAISPDQRHMVYTETVFIPTSHQISSKLIYVPLPPPQLDPFTGQFGVPEDMLNRYSLKSPDLKRHTVLSVNFDNYRQEEFRTLTVIDWSQDSSKVLIKEKIGVHNQGITETNLWLYDLIADQVYSLTQLRESIRFAVENNQHIDLDNLTWDINILGFSQESQSSLVVVDAMVYTKKGVPPNHLGIWEFNILNKKLTFVGQTFDTNLLECNALTLEEE